MENRKSELQGLPSCLNQGTSWRAIGPISSADSVGETPTLQPAGRRRYKSCIVHYS